MILIVVMILLLENILLVCMIILLMNYLLITITLTLSQINLKHINYTDYFVL
jgi:hypothetical protein